MSYTGQLVLGQALIAIPELDLVLAQYLSVEVVHPGGITGQLSFGLIAPGVGVLVVSTSLLDSSLIQVNIDQP